LPDLQWLLEVSISQSINFNEERALDEQNHSRTRRGGKPCIRGLRITVYDILSQLSQGASQQEILEDFPELEPEDILAALSFAADRERKVYSVAV